MAELVVPAPEGLYCPAGDFFIDPWLPVPRAVITHAHGDHAQAGSGRYWCSREAAPLLRARLGREAQIVPLAYGQAADFGAARVSLHPAGHVLGSAQVRIEAQGSVWVVSGDYKREADPSCAPFEPQACEVFVTEATFALPVYRWPEPAMVAREIHDWWMANRAAGEASVLFCYALGKAQRVLAELAQLSGETVYVHGAIYPLTEIYRAAGVRMLPALPVAQQPSGFDFRGQLVLAPPGAGGTPWMKRFRPFRTGFASGWMRIRGNRRRRGYDRGFVLSDHADWPSLLRTIGETGARRVRVMHGHADALVLWLRSQGLEADEIKTAFQGEGGA
ncbi:MAG TPA: ligase-associated DNA damage response exonuclease [Solimonas sp.]|nr:ligase-associated DNA damage response exonuclease [Solimonas sp.]